MEPQFPLRATRVRHKSVSLVNVNLIVIQQIFPNCLLDFCLRLGLTDNLFTSSLLTDNCIHCIHICHACYIPRQSHNFSLALIVIGEH
jgi:hypothetical protein